MGAFAILPTCRCLNSPLPRQREEARWEQQTRHRRARKAPFEITNQSLAYFVEVPCVDHVENRTLFGRKCEGFLLVIQQMSQHLMATGELASCSLQPAGLSPRLEETMWHLRCNYMYFLCSHITPHWIVGPVPPLCLAVACWHCRAGCPDICQAGKRGRL
jgi:hypothetical protein